MIRVLKYAKDNDNEDGNDNIGLMRERMQQVIYACLL
jgi:hypothetical protein